MQALRQSAAAPATTLPGTTLPGTTTGNRGMANRHAPAPSRIRIQRYGQIFFGFLSIANDFGSSEVNCSTAGLNCEHSP